VDAGRLEPPNEMKSERQALRFDGRIGIVLRGPSSVAYSTDFFKLNHYPGTGFLENDELIG
jgi:hypothetical protein